MFLPSLCQVFVFLGLFLAPPSFPQVNAQPAGNAATVYLALFEQLPNLKTMTDEQREILSNWKEAKLDENAAKVVALYQKAFKLMHLAAGVKDCDWSIRPKSGNTFPTPLTIDCGPKARELLNAVCLSSRLAFSEKQYRGAADDLLDLLAFTRHFPRGEGLTERMMADAMEKEANTPLADHLNEIRDQQILKVIRQRYSALPAVVPLQEIFLQELKNMQNMMQQVPATVPGKDVTEAEKKDAEKQAKAMVAEFDEVTKQAIAVAALPPGQLDEATKAFEEKFKAARGFGASMATAYAKVIRASRIGLAHRAMFRAALDIQIDGADQLKKHPDPFGADQFEYRKLENGFELKSKLKDGKGEQIVLKVGS